MLQKKVCMIGDFSVGKTSAVGRYVKQSFSDKYLTTVGVKIDTKMIILDPDNPKDKMKFILWDIAGNQTLTTAATSYLRGAAGFLLVVDGTRLPTWHNALNLQAAVTKQLGNIPFVTLLNKADLVDEWEVSDDLIQPYLDKDWHIFKTSAKTGDNIETAFECLARNLKN